MGGADVLSGTLDVSRIRESTRRGRLWRIALFLVPIAAYLYYRIFTHNLIRPGLPHFTPEQMQILLPVGLIVVLCLVLVVPMTAMGKSPHVRYDASEISTTLDDVVGLGPVKEEVVKTLNLFLGYQTFRTVMGGNPRKGVLFEGPPGTGKTYMAKAMAHEAGVPFLFVSSTAFQSQYYGATGRKIRNYFKELRKAAAEEGGAIGFIEEIDAIAGARSGMRAVGLLRWRTASTAPTPNGRTVERNTSEGISGVVNELLIQMQSFDTPTGGHKFAGWFIDGMNRLLPTHRRIKKAPPKPANVLLIAATNRAADLDPALLRPGRFDRSIHFDLPSRSGRRDIIDYYLDRKAHVPELDKEERRDALAAMTFGYTPVMIEHIFDEGLVWALRDGQMAMDWGHVQQAKMTEEIGLKQPVEYTDEERRTIATHEAGHATVAYLVGQNRKLEVLSIIKRRDALGLLVAQRRRGTVHAHAFRAARDDEDRVRRDERRGAVLRGVGDRSVERPHARHEDRRADGGFVRNGGLARLVRGDRARPDLAGHRRQGARQRRGARRGREVARAVEGRRAGDARRQPPPRRRAARPVVGEVGVGRRRDRRRVARGRSPQASRCRTRS